MNIINYLFGRNDNDDKEYEKFKKDRLKEQKEFEKKAADSRRSFLRSLAVAPIAAKVIIDSELNKPKEEIVIPREKAGFELDKSITEQPYITHPGTSIIVTGLDYRSNWAVSYIDNPYRSYQ